MITLKLTYLPHLKQIVIKQAGGTFFIASKDSIVIDEAGFLEILENLMLLDMIDKDKVKELVNEF